VTRLFQAKPYIIAEVGSNWGTFDDCLDSIRVAKECGADAVKFQMFNEKALYGFNEDTAYTDLIIDGFGSFLPGEIPATWLPALRAKADEVGIEFGCTAFSPELVAVVDPYVHWHKVASSDAAWPQMLEAVGACKKPVLLSTGAKTNAEVTRAMNYLGPKVSIVALVCVASYPADYVNLDAFVTGRSGLGLSDHTLGYTATVEAARCGAVVIEKHFTAFPEMDTPDRPHSLTPPQLKRMIDIIRGKAVESEEKDMFLRHNRRLIATQDIAPGDKLTYGVNYGAYRSLKDDERAACPFDWQKVEARMAKGPIGRGDGISLEDVE
jgi:N,N'-diacetyllegionaminate synthase